MEQHRVTLVETEKPTSAGACVRLACPTCGEVMKMFVGPYDVAMKVSCMRGYHGLTTVSGRVDEREREWKD
jgi:hypothetical protein